MPEETPKNEGTPKTGPPEVEGIVMPNIVQHSEDLSPGSITDLGPVVPGLDEFIKKNQGKRS